MLAHFRRGWMGEVDDNETHRHLLSMREVLLVAASSPILGMNIVRSKSKWYYKYLGDES